MHKFIILLFVLNISIILSGCGETFTGLGKDAKRVSKGVGTVFFRQK